VFALEPFLDRFVFGIFPEPPLDHFVGGHDCPPPGFRPAICANSKSALLVGSVGGGVPDDRYPLDRSSANQTTRCCSGQQPTGPGFVVSDVLACSMSEG
jgi:hypothetical protein